MLRPQIPDKMAEHELTHYLTILIEKLIKKIQDKRPDLKLSPELPKELAQNVAKLMLKNGEFSRKSVIDEDPEFIHKLTIALVRTATFGKHANLAESLKKLFDDKGVKNEDDLKKKLSPTELKKLEDLKLKMQQELLNNLQELKSIKRPAPAPSPKPQTKKEEEDKMINLYGLLNSYMDGSIPVPPPTDWGNARAFNNVNPNFATSFANISEKDKPDQRLGDSSGLLKSAHENYAAFGGANMIEEVKDKYRHDMSMMPSLHPR